MLNLKSLTRVGIVLCFICMVSSCNTNQESSGDLITIDVEAAFDSPHKEINLSEIVKNIEYVKLETQENCFVGKDAIPMSISENYLLINQVKPQRILLFTRSGKYLNDIGAAGRGPGEYTGVSILQISPNENQVLLRDYGKNILIYNIDGKFEQSLNLANVGIGGPSFNSKGEIIVFKARNQLPKAGGNQILICDSDLKLIDSCLYSDYDPAPPQEFVFDEMISNNVDLFYTNKGNDTLYQITDQREIYPENILDLGRYAVPPENITYDEMGDYMANLNFTSTPQYYLRTFFNDPKIRRGRSYFVFNKKTHVSLFLKTHEIFTPNGVSKSKMPINDLDGLANPNLFYTSSIRGSKSEVISVDKLEIPDVQEYFDTKIIEPDKLATDKFYNRVKKLLDESTIEDNPIIRICYLK